jgi:hypothetical protein
MGRSTLLFWYIYTTVIKETQEWAWPVQADSHFPIEPELIVLAAA